MKRIPAHVISRLRDLDRDPANFYSPDCRAGFCPGCGERVKAQYEDRSFDHAFGTERDGAWVCAECGEDLEDVDRE